MARPESLALGGYFPTPQHLIPTIAKLVDMTAVLQSRKLNDNYYTIVDPVAGTGDAVTTLIEQWWPGFNHNCLTVAMPKLYVCELELGRGEQLFYKIHHPWYEKRAKGVRGDALCLEWGNPAGHILFLNPPYDVDRTYGRLEHRFLRRFTDCLIPGHGILIYVVPFYALAASATYIAEQYGDVHCFKFPEPEFQEFKQVVLVARRRKTPDTFGAAFSPVKQQAEAWAADANGIPVLQAKPVIALEDVGVAWEAFAEWRVNDIDVQTVYDQYTPWLHKGKPAYGMGVELGLDEMVGSRYPVAMPPKPAHTAIALASGLVNGRVVFPDKPESGLPPIVAKGIFTKEFHSVDEKKNKDGKTVAVIEVEQPSLSVSVLDMHRWEYADLKPGIEPSGVMDVADMNIADLLTHYGMSLAEVMMQQCPPLHNPSNPDHQLELPILATRPFRAQAQVITGMLKMLFTDQKPFCTESPFVLGEVGTGKTGITLAVLEALNPKNFPHIQQQLAAMGISGGRAKPAQRALVICPPHLLKGWRDQATKFLPGAKTAVLERVSDVINGLQLQPNEGHEPGAGLIIFILSREMAKLGHAWGDGRKNGRCPTCDAVIPFTAEKITEERLWCDHRTATPANDMARWAMRVGSWLVGASTHHHLQGLVGGRFMDKYTDRLAQKFQEMADNDPNKYFATVPTLRQEAWQRRALGDPSLNSTPFGAMLNQFADKAISLALKRNYEDAFECVDEWLIPMLLAFSHPERDQWIAGFLLKLWPVTMHDRAELGTAGSLRERLKTILLLMSEPNSTLQTSTWKQMTRLHNPGTFRTDSAILRLHQERQRSDPRSGAEKIRADVDGLYYLASASKEVQVGSVKAAELLLEKFALKAKWDYGRKCNTPLFQAIPNPRRVALSDYIAKYAAGLFDVLVIDEAHEYANDNAAQSQAAHRLVNMSQLTMALTGTSNNGYASSLFANMWSLSGNFRQSFGFGSDGLMDFVNRYGYRMVKTEPKDEDYDKFASRFGVMSDAKDGGAMNVIRRKIGEAPGVNPLFILRHLLPSAVLIHKADLDLDMPPPQEIRKAVRPDKALQERYADLEDQVLRRIKHEWSVRSGLAAKLWWAVAQLPTYLDRATADVGNDDESEGDKRIFAFRLPLAGREIFASVDLLDADVILPKEQWMLKTISAELRQNRPVTVMLSNTGSGAYLPLRLQRLIKEHIGDVSVVLNAQKVKAKDREQWLDEKVIGKRKTVLITNAKAIGTGLNNLVYFPTAVWMQNPNCSPIVYEQGNGRFHRPGQEQDVKIYVPYYVGTSQETQLELLARKIQATKQTDGLDVTSALIAAGAGGRDGLDVMAVGRAIYEMLLKQKEEKVYSEQYSVLSDVAEKRPLRVAPKLPKFDGPAKGEQLRLLEPRANYAWVGGE